MDESAVINAIVTLAREHLLDWTQLTALAYNLSLQGWRRPQIVSFFWQILNSAPGVLTDSYVDLIGDFNMHMVGQCNVEQIIRLSGDPDNLDDLATRVAVEMRGWTPPK